MSTFDRVKNYFAETMSIPAETITSASRLGDLMRDSLDIVELTFWLDEEFEIDIPEAALGNSSPVPFGRNTTVREIVNHIETWRRK